MKINVKRNSRLKSFLFTFIGFIIIFVILAISTFNTGEDYQHRIFTDISDLDVLAEYTTEKISNDKFLVELIPQDTYRAKIKWVNKLFYVYAYEFETTTDCMEYVKNRKMSYFDDESFHLSGNILTNNKYIVYSQNKVLYIEGPALKYLYDFLDFTSKDFDNIID